MLTLARTLHTLLWRNDALTHLKLLVSTPVFKPLARISLIDWNHATTCKTLAPLER